MVEGQTQWNMDGSKLNASAFFFVYASGAVLAVLLLLPPLCRWPLHTGVSLNFWRTFADLFDQWSKCDLGWLTMG